MFNSQYSLLDFPVQGASQLIVGIDIIGKIVKIHSKNRY